MIPIEYVKALGFFLALIHAIRKWQHASSWIRIGSFSVGYAELAMGYFAGTLICSLIFWPNMTTYAVWFYYGLAISIVAIYRMLRFETCSHILIWIVCALAAAELVIILTGDELLWEWEWNHIVAGIAGCMLCTGLFAGLKLVCGGESTDECS